MNARTLIAIPTAFAMLLPASLVALVTALAAAAVGALAL